MTPTRRSLLRAACASAALGIAAPALIRSARAQGLPTLRMMAAPYGSQSYIPFVMERYGLAEKHGFNLEVVTYTDTRAASAALQSGAAEVAVQDWAGVARARRQGLDMRIVAPFTTYVSVFTASTGTITPGIAAIPELAGRKFGSFTRNGVDWIMFKALARRDFGFDIDTDMEVTEGAPTLLRGLLEQGQLDAGLLYSSVTPPMIASGDFASLFTAGQVAEALGLPRAIYLALAMRGDYLEANPEAATGFVSAYQEVYDILLAEDEPWQIRGAQMSMEGRALEIYRDQMRGDLLRALDADSAPVLQRAFDIMLETAGAETIGLDALPEGVIDATYQP